ncbi:MAG: hypothetical protein ACLT98_10155 [Eggerthellaceae bacterium]
MPSETMNRREGACTCSASQPLDGNDATELARRHQRARTLRATSSACAAVLATTLVALGGCSENDAVGKTRTPRRPEPDERPGLSGRSLRSPRSTSKAGGENGVSIDASNLAKATWPSRQLHQPA